MARHIGPMEFEGTVGGLTFYKLKGVRRVKAKSHVSKKKIRTSRRSQGTRDMNMEQGGSSKAATMIRTSLKAMEVTFGHSYISGYLTGSVRKMTLLGQGKRGERAIDFRQHGLCLVGFEFDPDKPLGYSMGRRLIDVTLNAERDLVTWNVPAFEPSVLVSPPAGATHLRFVLAAGQVSNFYYNSTLKSYEPAVRTTGQANSFIFSEPFAVDAPVIGPLQLQVSAGGLLPTPDEMAVVMTAGIAFSELVNGDYYPFADKAALQIVGVG